MLWSDRTPGTRDWKNVVDSGPRVPCAETEYAIEYRRASAAATAINGLRSAQPVRSRAGQITSPNGKFHGSPVRQAMRIALGGRSPRRPARRVFQQALAPVSGPRRLISRPECRRTGVRWQQDFEHRSFGAHKFVHQQPPLSPRSRPEAAAPLQIANLCRLGRQAIFPVLGPATNRSVLRTH